MLSRIGIRIVETARNVPVTLWPKNTPQTVYMRAKKTATAIANVSFFAQKKIAETTLGVGAGPRSDLRDLFVSIHPQWGCDRNPLEEISYPPEFTAQLHRNRRATLSTANVP